MKIKLSATDNMVPGSTWTEKAELLHKLGFSGMAIFVDYPDWKEEMLDEMLHLEERTGVKCCEFVFTGPIYGHLMDKDKKIQRDTIELYKRSIDIANKLGAITEMEYEYRTQDPLPLFDPYLQMPKEEEETFLKITEELGACCKDQGYMLIEACNRYETKYLTTLESCRDILEKCDPKTTKNMGLIADFFHLAIEEKDPAESVLECAKWIKHVHLGDSNRLAPGYGHTDWEAIIRNLKKIEFNGYMNLECGLTGDRVTALKDVLDYFTAIEARV